jgi:putative ABC transport system substrate-binding protein
VKRRYFIKLIGGAAAAVAWPLQLGAQQPSTRRIAFVHSGFPAAKLSESGGVFWIKTFYEELRKLGYAEGTNLVVERFSAEGNTSRYASLAAEVVARAPELIVANQNVLVKALTTATATIPIVGITTDPVAVGLVSNIARPGGNLTGVSVDGGAGLNAKRLQILKEIVPAATRIAFVTSRRQEIEALGVPIIERLLAEVTETELGRVLDEMAREKIDAVLVSQGGDFLAHRTLIVGLAAKHRLPAMYPFRDYVELGGLVAYAPDLGELAKRMAADVQQILNGAKAGDIPFWQPAKWEMVINLKTAKTLGLAIPQGAIIQADEVIE